MKRAAFLTIALISILAFAGGVSAQMQNTGCGLGSMIFEGETGLVQQVLAVTTNSSFGNQTFGISSGTSRCEQPTNLASNRKLNEFVAENMDPLAKDIARGQGEYLETLAVLLDVPPQNRKDFGAKLQNNFSLIYTGETVTHADVLNNIQSVL